MKHVIIPKRTEAQGPHSPAEVQGFHATRDREAAAIRTSVVQALGTLGLPDRMAEVLQATVPVLVDAASVLARALHVEAPGGPSLTHAELGRLATAAAHEIERRIAVELAHLVTEPAAITMDSPLEPADAPPTPTVDPAAVASGTVTPIESSPTPAPTKATRAKATLAPDAIPDDPPKAS